MIEVMCVRILRGRFRPAVLSTLCRGEQGRHLTRSLQMQRAFSLAFEMWVVEARLEM